MADDQQAANEVEDEGEIADYDANDGNDGNDMSDVNDAADVPTTTTTAPESNIDNGENAAAEDYDDDGPLPDVTVKLIINDEPGSAVTDPVDGVVTNIIDAGVLDELGNVVTTTSSIRDAIDDYSSTITQEIIDGISGNGTDISEKKGWWSSLKSSNALVIGLIALCIIGIILALIFIIIGKKSKKRGSPTTNPPGETPKGAVGKSVTRDPKYSPVPTSV